MDLFGEHNEIQKEAKKDVSMHIPLSKDVVKPAPQTPLSPLTPELQKQKVSIKDAINLSAKYQRKKMLLRILMLVLSMIAVLVVMIVSGWLAVDKFILNKKPKTITPTTITPTQPTLTQPAITPTPITPVTNIPVPLPDTPLAPLRGSLIRLQGSQVVYLIENNGELREIQTATVIFENGQKMQEISPTLIYTLPSRWSTVRRGQQVVTGQVDFDPRVLTNTELITFIQ